MTAACVRRSALLSVVTALCVVAVEHVSSQTTTAADGPWSGSAQCVLTAQFMGQGETYLNQQTHTWTLTSTMPVSGTDLKVYASTWKVTGQGTHSRQYGDGRTLTEQWTTAGQAMPDTITIRVGGDGLVHITSGAQARSNDAVNGTSTTHSINGAARDQTRAIAYYVDEWPFPVAEDAAGKTTISGSSTRAASNVAPGQPPGTTSTAACSWQFVRGTTAASAPPPAPPPTPIVVAAVPARAEAGRSEERV